MSSQISTSMGKRGPSRRFSGPAVAVGLVAFIIAVAFVAQMIHVSNLRARRLASADALAAEAAEVEANEAAEADEATDPAAD